MYDFQYERMKSTASLSIKILKQHYMLDMVELNADLKSITV